MILDGHIHITSKEKNRDEFVESMHNCGLDGGVLLSLPPASFIWFGKPVETSERLENLFYWTGKDPDLYPFFWIDPMENDALKQVELADKYGVMGFKVICNRFFPGDKTPLEVFRAIADIGKPILFHSGILWDGGFSSRFNRPAEFEALLDVDGLKFALAHVSWPWCDECIAVYGKFLSARTLRPDLNVEMFIDITPGTPPNYREEVLTKLYKTGYDIGGNIIFGTDGCAENYNCKNTQEILNLDNGIYSRLHIDGNGIEKIYSENLKRFIGKDEACYE